MQTSEVAETLVPLRIGLANAYGNKARGIVEPMKALKMAVFWDIPPYSLVDIDRRFRGAYSLHHLFILVAVRENLRFHQ
jgi:reverse gyrase